MIVIYLLCRYFILINNLFIEKERWYERVVVWIFYIDFFFILSWMEKFLKVWFNVCVCFLLEIIKVLILEKLVFNKMY